MRAEPGLVAEVTLTVGEADTAVALGSGDVAVLGTPRLVALCEEATVAAVGPALEEGETSVGTEVVFEHLLATTVGAEVRATARLVGVERRRLRFTVGVREGDRLVARGTITRAVVQRDRFMKRLEGS